MCALAFTRQTHVDDEFWTLFSLSHRLWDCNIASIVVNLAIKDMNVFILIQGALP
jgi:hypothetical protein